MTRRSAAPTPHPGPRGGASTDHATGRTRAAPTPHPGPRGARWVGLVLALSGLLAACGGGGGSDSGIASINGKEKASNAASPSRLVA